MLTILRYFWFRYVNSLFIYSKIKCKKYFPILFLMYLILSIHIYIYIKYVNSYLNCEYRFEKIYRRKETREHCTK